MTIIVSFRRILGLLVIAPIAAAGLLLGGCATASNPTSMIPTVAAPAHKHSESVSVQVTGGSATSALGASNIADQDFAQAISTAITQSGLFAKIATSPAGDYQLDVQIVRLDRPSFGLSFTVTLEANWRLKRGNELVWEKAVQSSFTATAGDSLVGVTRLRLANEGAARNNINDAIVQMGALDLK